MMSPAPAARIRATPYARRLARERNLSLEGVAGSGPAGRITGDDVESHRPADSARSPLPSAAPPISVEAASAVVDHPAAIAAVAAIVDCGALDVLLARIKVFRTEVGREEMFLKAAAVALETSAAGLGNSDILLLAGPSQRQFLPGVAHAALGVIASMRSRAGEDRIGGLAVSFLGRAGVRPVAAQLVGEIPLRLVIGAPDKTGSADCLLSYDPSRVGDDAAEDLLATFRELVETPFRLLV